MKTKNLFVITLWFVLMLLSTIGYAHEKRLVANQFDFIVGFAIEPAFSGQMNGVDLRVLTSGQTIEGLEKTLRVTVSREHEKRTMDLDFKSKYKEPGRYNAYFLPTQPGTYIFKIQGQINGVPIDETFKSGDKFHDVEDVAALRFP